MRPTEVSAGGVGDGDGGWRRLAASAVVPLTIRTAVETLRQSWQALAGALAGLHFGANLFASRAGWLLAGGGILALFGAVGLLRWWHFRFRFDERTIEVREGILHRRAMRLPFARVQNLRIDQPFYLRPLGLVSLHLDGAGSAGSEVDLAAVPRALAERIAEHIRTRRALPRDDGRGEGVEDEASLAVPGDERNGARLILSRGIAALARHGLASNYVWLFLGAIVSFLGTIGGKVRVRLPAGVLEAAKDLPLPLLAIAGVLLVVLLIFVLSAVASVVIHHGFRLERTCDGVWRASGGLLDRREKRIPEHKIQALVIHQTAIGRWLGVWDVVFHHAGGSGPTSERIHAGGRVRRFLVPGLDRAEATRLVDEVFGAGSWAGLEWQGVDRYYVRHRLRYAVFLPLLGLLLALGLAAFLVAPPPADRLSWLAGGMAGWTLLAGWAIRARWRRAGQALAPDLFGVSDGIVARRLVLFRPFKIQWVRLAAGPGERRHGLASLVIALAGQRPAVPFVPRSLACALRDRLVKAAACDLRPWF